MTTIRIAPAAVRDPTATTPVRHRPSIRRTSHIDMLRGDTDEGLVLDGRARDLVTLPDGAAEMLDDSAVHAVLSADRRLVSITTTPPRDLDQLLVRHVASGFRAAAAEAVPADTASGSPLHLLLDDLPVATLISGYVDLYRPDRLPRSSTERMLERDICSGWRSDGTMMTAVDQSGRIPVPVGPSAPALEREDDPVGWHLLPPLPPGSMRRRRLVDVRPGTEPGAPTGVAAMFRDTYVDERGHETVLHEYDLDVVVDPSEASIVRCEAQPRVLPWDECPHAAGSARRLVGHQLSDVRRLVRDEFRGTSTCTHLNDLLRSLGDVPLLLRALARALD